MNDQKISWVQDGIDPGWFIAEDVGSVRSSSSYRAGGWWFLPEWMPDSEPNDIGPFKSKADAMA